EVARDAEDVEPRVGAREALCRRLQSRLRDVDRNIGRRPQPPDQQPGLQALAAALLDQLATVAGKARDVLAARATRRELAAGRVILLQAADRLEQAAALGIVEIFRGEGLLG